jgi:hypothetical protein
MSKISNTRRANGRLVEQQETAMNTQINLLSDDQLNAVSGGIKNDPLTTHTKIVEMGPQIAAAKKLGNLPGGIYVGNTATTAGGPLGSPIFL